MTAAAAEAVAQAPAVAAPLYDTGRWQPVTVNVVALSIAYLALFLVDGPTLIRQRQWRDLAVYLALFATAAAFSFHWAIVRPPTSLHQRLLRALEPLARIVLGPP